MYGAELSSQAIPESVPNTTSNYLGYSKGLIKEIRLFIKNLKIGSSLANKFKQATMVGHFKETMFIFT